MSMMPHALAFQMRRHAEHRADRDHAGAADAVDDARPFRRRRRARTRAHPARPPADRPSALPAQASELRPVHRHEGRAEALQAGEILVAARLVDPPLAAELRLDRLDGHAVRLHAAVAAALADEFVDQDPLVGIGEGAALAPPAFLRGAGLVVEQHRDAGNRLQFALHGVEVVAMMDRRAGREVGAAGIFVRLVGDDRDALDAFGAHLPGNLVDGEVRLRHAGRRSSPPHRCTGSCR